MSKITALLITLLLSSLIITVVIWNNYARETINNLSFSHATDLIEISNSNFENDTQMLVNALQYISSDKKIISNLSNPSVCKQKLTDYYSTMSEYLNGIAIVFPDGLYHSGVSYFPNSLINSKIYNNIVAANGKELIFNRFNNNDIFTDSKIFSIGIKLNSSNIEGVLIADMKSSLFVKHFGINNMNSIFRTLLVENNTQLIFSNESSFSYSSVHHLMKYVSKNNLYNTFFDIELNNVKYTIMAKKLTLYPHWTNITLFPTGSLYSSYYKTLYYTIWIILIIISLTTIFALLILTNITKKFNKLIRYTENIDLSNVHNVQPLPQKSGQDEFDIIADKIYTMINTLAEQVNLISDMEEKKHIQELEALRAQINPHFIYNSLNIIQTLADTQKNSRISEIANSLSSLLRYSATNTDGFVTLGDEIEHITNYITIMQNKFLNKIKLLIDIDPKIFGCSMLKMCLQPIIENSVRHGLTDSPDNYIMIKAYNDDDTVTIQIIDNGTGIPEEKLKTILDYSDNQSEHLGLKNVDRRIKLTFGSEYGLDIFSMPNIQTIVTITIPYIEKEVLKNE